MCNKSHPEGSIAEAYISNEALTFCSMYLRDVESAFNRPERNNDGVECNAKISVFAQKVRLTGGSELVEYSKKQMEVIYWYILDNCDEIESFREYVSSFCFFFIYIWAMIYGTSTNIFFWTMKLIHKNCKEAAALLT